MQKYPLILSLRFSFFFFLPSMIYGSFYCAIKIKKFIYLFIINLIITNRLYKNTSKPLKANMNNIFKCIATWEAMNFF
jgi:hypothetical protein